MRSVSLEKKTLRLIGVAHVEFSVVFWGRPLSVARLGDVLLLLECARLLELQTLPYVNVVEMIAQGVR